MNEGSEYVSGEYVAKHPDWHQLDSPWKAKEIGKIIRRNDISFKKVVDVGCGAGRVIHELSKDFSDDVLFRGYDISSQAIDIAKDYESENVLFECSDFLMEETEFVDVLLVIDVFEHIEDYLGFLQKLRNRSSYYVFHIPLDMNIQWLLRDKQIGARDSIGHLHYFWKILALRTLEDTGFEIVDWFYTDKSEVASEHSWGMWAAIANVPRRILFPIFPDFTVKLLGGYSLMVLAK